MPLHPCEATTRRPAPIYTQGFFHMAAAANRHKKHGISLTAHPPEINKEWRKTGGNMTAKIGVCQGIAKRNTRGTVEKLSKSRNQNESKPQAKKA